MAEEKTLETQAKKKKPAPKTNPKSMASLEAKENKLLAELRGIRAKILQNESYLAKKIAEKIRAEDELNKLLMRNLSEEKTVLAMVKKGAARKQAGLEQKIASLKSIEKVYSEKKRRIFEAKKRQAALKKQLHLLEKKVEQ